MLRINVDSTMNEIELKPNINNLIKKNIKKKGNDKINKLYEWDLDSNTKLYAYGWCDGEAGYENKHELLPNGYSDILTEDSNDILLFGDIFILKKVSNKYSPINISEYGEIYLNMCEGFDNCSDESDLSEEEDEEYKEEEEEEEEEEELEYLSNDELDIDENSYSEEEEELSEEELSEEEELSGDEEELSEEELSGDEKELSEEEELSEEDWEEVNHSSD